MLCLVAIQAAGFKNLGLAEADINAYKRLPGNKAIAQAIGTNTAAAVSFNEPNEHAAVVAALAKCRLNIAQAKHCELVQLNNESITTGASLRAKLGNKPHPLFLWRYRSNTTTIFLMGSVHALKPSTYPLPPQFEEAFKQAQNLVLEVNLAKLNPADLQQSLQQRALLPNQQTLIQHLGPELTLRVADALKRYGVDVLSLTQLKPAAVTQQLVMLRLLTMGYPNNSGIEQYFLTKLSDKSVQGLETIDEQLDLLFNQPMSVQIALLEETLDQFDQVDQQMSDLVFAWLTGDGERMLSEFKAQAGSSKAAKRFYKQLLDDRNVAMARKIGQLRNKPGTHLVVVGAAHCPGDNGIVSLLAQQGLQGQRIWSNQQITKQEEQQ